MKKFLHILGHIVVCAIFILAIFLLYNKLKDYSIAQIRSCIDQISWGRIFFSMFLMIINYLILVGYDWLALKAINKKLPLYKVGLVSFIGQAVSYNFGALLGGTSVRYRFYSAWNFSIAEIVRLVLMLAVTFWVGALGLCGLIFIVAPPVIPEALLHGMPIKDIRFLGIILIVIASSYLILCFAVRKPICIFGKEFFFPHPHIAVMQCLVAGIDIIAAATCMYVLLPGHLHVSFIEFLPGYLLAQVAVVLTHIPGGVGVFELVILELTHTTQEQAVFAAVLLFRLIYYIIPLIAAAILLAVYEMRQRSNMMREAGRWLSVLSHSISAYLVFVAGLIFLVSSTLPTAWQKLPYFMHDMPHFALAAGHFICALSGAGLLFIAYGLERRQRKAFLLSIIFLSTGIAGAIIKGFSWETALMAGCILIALVLAKKRFYRLSSLYLQKIPFKWLATSFTVLFLIFLLGWFLYHPSWNKAEIWGFERHLNAKRTLVSYAGIFAMLIISFVWRFWKRKNTGNELEKR